MILTREQYLYHKEHRDCTFTQVLHKDINLILLCSHGETENAVGLNPTDESLTGSSPVESTNLKSKTDS